MNVEFLQTIRNTRPQQDPCSRNGAQALYLISSKLFEQICLETEEALKNNAQNQEIKARAKKGDIPENAQIALTYFIHAIETPDSKLLKVQEMYLHTRWELLTDYGAVITAEPGCPEEIKNLFTPDQRKQIIGQPIENQLVDLALQTQW